MSKANNNTEPSLSSMEAAQCSQPQATADAVEISDLVHLDDMKTEFRRSLEAEAEEKERQRALEADLAANSKAQLRESIMSLSAKSALTTPERNFLQMLLDSDSPGAAEACMVAHRTLMDGNIFTAICGGAAGEAHAPGHNWTSSSISSDRNENKGEWVEEWVSRGSQESSGGNPEVDKDDLSAPTNKSARPHQLVRKSSEARLSRLALRRKQSSSGGDGSRLFKAHEVGLSLTPAASARRSLQKIGLPMEKGNFMPPPPLNVDEKTLEGEKTPFGLERIEGSPAVDSGKKNLENPEPLPTSFDEALAKMDERTIRRIEKEERAKQNAMEVDTTVMHNLLGPAGCGGSPFSMNILGLMFKSKQFSFRRESSSYTRYDSFLMSTDNIDEDGSTRSDTNKEIESAGSIDSESLTSPGIVLPSNKDDIFRPSSRPKTHEERLENLLINAGLKGRHDDSEEHIATSPAEFVRSASNSSVAILMQGGVEDKSVFREKPKPELDTTKFSMDDKPDQRTVDSDGSPDASSSIGDLPSELTFRARRKRGSTSSIMKSSTTSAASPRKGSYKRSISWGSDVFKQEVSDLPLARLDSSCSSRISVMSFPHLRRAGPLRSDSIGSISSAVLSIPPIRTGAPVRSDSVGSVSNASIFSGPSLHHATSIHSVLGRAPSLKLAHEIRSISQTTLGLDDDDDDEDSINSENPPKVLRCGLPPRPAQRGSSGNVMPRGVVIRNTSNSQFYPGDGFEVEEVMHLDSARKMKSMVSASDMSVFSSASSRHLRRGSSAASRHSRALDDGFIVRDIAFERHASEILRSLSNEDLYDSHNNLETIQRSTKNIRPDALSTMRVMGDESTGDESWDIDASTNTRAPLPTNAWSVLQDEYSYGYGGLGTLPFKILGTHAGDSSCHPHVLSPPLMESLQNFLPPQIAETNFWLKYSLVRDGASLQSLLQTIRGTRYAIIAIETVEGEVFGSFTSTPWRRNWNYFGSGECFLWRMRRSRSEKDAQTSVLDQAKLESELDVFYWTGQNELVQYCTHDIIAIGGGSIPSGEDTRDDQDEQRKLPPMSDRGGFGLAIDSELLRGTSSPCGTFSSPPLSKLHPNGSPFEVLNVEVWTLSPCNTVAEAENLEMTSLFLESYSRDL